MRRPAWSEILESSFVFWPLCLIGVGYLFSMLIVPFFAGGFSWEYVQAVWDRWQGLNVGVLAFAASLTALSIARGQERRQLNRQFNAARAFLPQTLSELCDYCDACASVLLSALRDPALESGVERSIDVEVPTLPSSVWGVFTQCIQAGEADVASHLTRILGNLQVFGARLRGFSERRSGSPIVRVRLRQEVLGYLVDLGKVRALINKTFPFAREQAPLNSSPQTVDEVRTAFHEMEIYLESVDGLMEVMQRHFPPTPA